MKVRIRTIVILLLVGAAGTVAFLWAGIYNVAATEQHTLPVYRLIHYVMRQSVNTYSEDVVVPELTGEQRLRSGFLHYRDKCLQCHGAPGVAPDKVGRGMTPAPANLVATAREWTVPEIYWVVRHGVKMTGMPAWEYRLSDSEIWDVVAFVMRLPVLSPMEYAELNRKMPVQPNLQKQVVTAQHEDEHEHEHRVGPALGGSPEAGRRAIQQYLCATCHRIPGIVGANADVGPTLEGIGSRKYIAGVLPNTQQNMLHWLQHPQQVNPLSAMPDLGVNEQDARDIAAYLYTLEGPD